MGIQVQSLNNMYRFLSALTNLCKDKVNNGLWAGLHFLFSKETNYYFTHTHKITPAVYLQLSWAVVLASIILNINQYDICLLGGGGQGGAFFPAQLFNYLISVCSNGSSVFFLLAEMPPQPVTVVWGNLITAPVRTDDGNRIMEKRARKALVSSGSSFPVPGGRTSSATASTQRGFSSPSPKSSRFPGAPLSVSAHLHHQTAFLAV